MNWPFGDMPMFGYHWIDADPAWFFDLYNVETGGAKSAHAHYDCMSLDEIKALPVGQLAGSDCGLSLWTTGWAMARGDALDVCKAWGATPISEIVWRKVFESGKSAMGPGYRVRTMHEPILLATWGNPKHKAFPSIFDGVRREHSEKPDEWYELLVKHTPRALRRACLFSAGRERPGFDTWGQQHSQKPWRNDADQSGGERQGQAQMDGVRGDSPDLFARAGQLRLGHDQPRDESAGEHLRAEVSQPQEAVEEHGAAAQRGLGEGGEHEEAAG